MSIKDYEAKFRPLETLTPKQLQVFEMAGAGLTCKAIGYELGITAKMASNHMTVARKKLNAKDMPTGVLAASWLVWRDLRHHIGLALFLVLLSSLIFPTTRLVDL